MKEYSALGEAYEALPLARPEPDGTIPKQRLKSPSALRSIHTQFRDDDRLNAFNRAQCQSLLDGEPPYDQVELDEAGQTDTTNLNFQGAEQRLERAKAPYYRLATGGDLLVRVKTNFGPEDDRYDWEEILSEEISKTIRESPLVVYEIENLVRKHVWDGVGIPYWQDDEDWRFRAGGLGQVYFARGATATEENQEIITIYQEFTIQELVRIIDNEEEAKEEGWDVDEVRKAIQKASSTDPDWQDWERLMEEVKNNDISSGSRLPTVNIIHGLVLEFNGKVSHLMTTESGCNEKDFLYKQIGKFDSMSQKLVLMPYSIGTNAKIHGIRGLGYKLYPFEQQRNRSIGRLIDKGFEASSTMVQAQDETDLANIGLEYFGNLAVLPPGLNFVERPSVDLSRSVMPALQLMDRLVGERTAGYSTENIFDGDARKTKFEVAAQLDQSASLTEASLDFFYGPWRRVLREMVRRMTAKGYLKTDPGGLDVHKLKQRIERRGVPLDAFYKIDHDETVEVRVIGAGSAAAKTMSLERGNALYPRMDDVAKSYFDHMLAVDIFGPSVGNQLFPANTTRRTTVDTQIAALQNYHLMAGQEVPVLPTDKHLAHARVHIMPLMQMFEAVQAGQADLAEAAVAHQLLYVHTVEHVEQVEGDPQSVDEANMMRRELQKIGEIISNGMKEAQARAEEMAAQGEQGQAGPSPEELAAVEKARAEVRIMEQKAEADIANKAKMTEAEIVMKQEKARMEMALKDAGKAAEIARNRVK